MTKPPARRARAGGCGKPCEPACRVRGSEEDRPRIHRPQIHSPGESGRRPAAEPVIIRVAQARPRLRLGARCALGLAAGNAGVLSPLCPSAFAPNSGRMAVGRAVGGASRARSRRMRLRRAERAPSRRASSQDRASLRERPSAATSCRRGIFMPLRRHGAARIPACSPENMRAPRVSVGTRAGLAWCLEGARVGVRGSRAPLTSSRRPRRVCWAPLGSAGSASRPSSRRSADLRGSLRTRRRRRGRCRTPVVRWRARPSVQRPDRSLGAGSFSGRSIRCGSSWWAPGGCGRPS